MRARVLPRSVKFITRRSWPHGLKRRLEQSLLGQVFADKSKIAGQKVSDPQAREKIYQQYLRAYKKGVFNYIREDATPDGQTIPRKYFSGGELPIAPELVQEVRANNPEVRAFISRKSRESYDQPWKNCTSVYLFSSTWSWYCSGAA